jgi:predicted small metal-binding protein
MPSLTCDCGYEATGDDRHQVEAEMWHHALRDHEDQLKGMSVDQIADWLRDKDRKLATA